MKEDKQTIEDKILEIMKDLRENYKPLYFDWNDKKIKIHCETKEIEDFGKIELKDLEEASKKWNELFKKILGVDND